MPQRMPEGWIKELVDEALVKRQQLVGKLDAFRIFDGAEDGIESLFIDKIGVVLIVHFLPEHPGVELPENKELARAFENAAQVLSVSTIYLRFHGEQAKHSASRAPELIFGPTCSQFTVDEDGLKFIIKPEENVNAGIFLDMREIRSKIRHEAKDWKVLNLFCFTGSLGIAAFAGGAREVVQVDVSKKALTWAKENFELNKASLNLAGVMRFIPEDSITFLKREVKRIGNGKEPYELVIVDPPSFGSSGGGAFSFEKDVRTLVELSAAVLSRKGGLIITTNSRDFTPNEISQLVNEVAKRTEWKPKVISELLPPKVDFTSVGVESISMRGVWAQ